MQWNKWLPRRQKINLNWDDSEEISMLYLCCSNRTHRCCSLDRTSPPDMSCCRCGRTHSAQRSRPAGGRTCCSRSHSSARHSWGGPESWTEPQGRCASGSATAGWGWSSPSGRLSLSAPHRCLQTERLGSEKGNAEVKWWTCWCL